MHTYILVLIQLIFNINANTFRYILHYTFIQFLDILLFMNNSSIKRVKGKIKKKAFINKCANLTYINLNL